jgi:transcription factor C subunit 7
MTLDPPVDAVFSSPYYRCLQTITPFVELSVARGGERLVNRIRPEHGLSEWYGDADFEHPRPASSDTLKTMFAAFDETYESVLEPPATGEDIAQLHDRVALAMQGVIDRCDREGFRAVVLCTHAAVVIALGRVLTGVMPKNVDVEDFRAFTCGLSVYRRKMPTSQPTGTDRSEAGPRTHSNHETPSNCETSAWKGGRGVGGGWVCEVDSNCSFLSGGEERGW